MIAPDVIWLGDAPLRGPAEVLTSWQKFFDAPQAPFSWAPEIVEVQAGGTLALEHRPGVQCRGQTRRDLHFDLAPRDSPASGRSSSIAVARMRCAPKKLIIRRMATDYPVTMAIRALAPAPGRLHAASVCLGTARRYRAPRREHLGVDEHAGGEDADLRGRGEEAAVHPHARRSRGVGEESRAPARGEECRALCARRWRTGIPATRWAALRRSG